MESMVNLKIEEIYFNSLRDINIKQYKRQESNKELK